jgi:hypothetical protein
MRVRDKAKEKNRPILYIDYRGDSDLAWIIYELWTTEGGYHDLERCEGDDPEPAHLSDDAVHRVQQIVSELEDKHELRTSYAHKDNGKIRPLPLEAAQRAAVMIKRIVMGPGNWQRS